MKPRTAVRLRARGLVQGVSFRSSLARLAGEAGVTGWVRNMADGSVEAVLEGSEESVQDLVEWARHGPRGARVDSVEAVAVPTKHSRGFRILG